MILTQLFDRTVSIINDVELFMICNLEIYEVSSESAFYCNNVCIFVLKYIHFSESVCTLGDLNYGLLKCLQIIAKYPHQDEKSQMGAISFAVLNVCASVH